MTKKQAYKIIKKQYGQYCDSNHPILPLCGGVHPDLDEDWCEYWKNINETGRPYICSPYRNALKDKDILGSLARIMILHDFIEDTYK